MTLESYNNYVANVKYYTGQYAAGIADKARIGGCNLCDDLMNLNILNAYIRRLECYNLSKEDETDFFDGSNLITNGTFDTDLTGWNTDSFSWNSGSGGRAYYKGGTGLSAYISQDILIPSIKYNITFDLNHVEVYADSFVTIFCGTNSYVILSASTASIDINLTCEGNSTFKIQVTDTTTGTTWYIDNVVVTSDDLQFKKNCLSITQMKLIAEDINRILGTKYCVNFDLTDVNN